MNGKRAGLYLRVSTGEQTVENQREALTVACAHRGSTAASAAQGRDKRPGFDRLLVRNKRWGQGGERAELAAGGRSVLRVGYRSAFRGVVYHGNAGGGRVPYRSMAMAAHRHGGSSRSFGVHLVVLVAATEAPGSHVDPEN